MVSSRLISLDKNPDLSPIGVGEILRRIAGKVVMTVAKEDVRKAGGGLQLCTGEEGGVGAAIHTMHDEFQ